MGLKYEKNILDIQYLANSRRIDGYDTFQEIIVQVIFGTIFGSFKHHNVNRIKVEYLIHILFL
jgi:hypothetical protein